MPDRPAAAGSGCGRALPIARSPLAQVHRQREALLHALKIRYGKTYGELEREVTEFDFREIWAANMARPSLGIAND